ncbi:diacylglycerol kinase [Pseudomaricurvus alkylphenolicus]|uniref:NAD(P)H-dependent amine dehydrogenase family protein n=1 Tax=Pseudomaricurvus alkylphenolicus TaxID=1306991 RepID=UPI0014206BFE|nr:diacylglycerol kinase [Pseudomaricurvus alkylphenolicus]NIB38346.1 diacylglycerol kinase [Pseudomaricurvus alkylphenolicus]
MSKKFRVIQFGTGFVGHFALRAIIDHPDMELVGCWVHSDDKVGVDAGDIAGTQKTGILATNDIDALLELDADCLCSGAGGDGREEWVAEAHSRFLERGINIVSSSIVSMIDPDVHPNQALHDKLTRAALKGNASYFTSGIEPGFMSDTLPLTITGISQYWHKIRVQEILDYSTYIPNEAEKIMGDILGFGRPMDYQPILFKPGQLSYVWSGPVTLIARGLGVELDEVREVVEYYPAKEQFEVEGLGVIEPGTREAYRFELQGIVNGEAVIVLEHVTRLRPESAPEWEQGKFGEGYYVYVDGDPNMTCHMTCVGPDGDHHSGGILATGTRLVNAIPAVCAAKPGLISALDLPLIAGHKLRR